MKNKILPNNDDNNIFIFTIFKISNLLSLLFNSCTSTNNAKIIPLNDDEIAELVNINVNINSNLFKWEQIYGFQYE